MKSLIFLAVLIPYLTCGQDAKKYVCSGKEQSLILYNDGYEITQFYKYPVETPCMSFAETIIWSAGKYHYSGDTLFLKDKLGFEQYLVKDRGKIYLSGKTIKNFSGKRWYNVRLNPYDTFLRDRDVTTDTFPAYRGYAFVEQFFSKAARNMDSVARYAKPPKGKYICLKFMIDGHKGISSRIVVRKKKVTCYIDDDIFLTGIPEMHDGRLYIRDTYLNFTFTLLVDENGSLYPEIYNNYQAPVYIRRKDRANYPY